MSTSESNSTSSDRSSQDTSYTREVDATDREIYDQIRSCTFRGVKHFESTFLSDSTWAAEHHTIFNALTSPNAEDSSSCLAETNVEDWTSRCLTKASFVVLQLSSNTVCDEEDIEVDLSSRLCLRLDSSIAERSSQNQEMAAVDYKHVLVLGLQNSCQLRTKFSEDLVLLAGHAAKVFEAQPLRWFIQSFIICGSTMEAVVFDRSAIYTSETFDLILEPQRFAATLVSYATMTLEQLGIPNYCKSSSLTLTAADTGNAATFTWRDPVLFSNPSLQSRGTTCFQTTDGYIIKFSWSSDVQEPEAELLLTANMKGVHNIPKLLAHGLVTSTEHIRGKLELGQPYDFRRDDCYDDHLPPALIGDQCEPLKTYEASSQHTSRSRTNFDKNLVCIVITPAGRVLYDFRNIDELLRTMLDAVIAHRSLYQDAGILHRDVSPGNIVIVYKEGQEGSSTVSGSLIDLDMAACTNDSSRVSAHFDGGTHVFKGINALVGRPHTYRDDLESFLYVLIFMCTEQAWYIPRVAQADVRPYKFHCLQAWQGSWSRALWAKFSMLANFELHWINQLAFPSSLEKVRPLCRKLQEILFQQAAYGADCNNLPIFNVPEDSDELYLPVIEAFQSAIDSLEDS